MKKRNAEGLIPLTEFFIQKDENNSCSSNVDFNLLLNEIRELKLLIKSFLTQNVVVNKNNESDEIIERRHEQSNILGYGDVHAELLSELKSVLKRRRGMR